MKAKILFRKGVSELGSDGKTPIGFPLGAVASATQESQGFSRGSTSMMKKLTLFLLKAVPVIGAICCALNSTLSYFYIDVAWTGYILYFAFLVGWLALAYYFKFCSFYFMLILYILLSEALNLIDYFYPLPLSDKGVFVLHCGIIGATILFFTYFHVRDTRKLREHLKKNG